MKANVWTDEITAAARKMIDDGETYAGTATRLNRAFGTSFSRSSVAGMIHRSTPGKPAPRRRHNSVERTVVDWTPELLARAKALYEAHHSAAEIARTLRGNVTAAAVSAKARRLGWKGGSRPGPKPGIPRTTFRGSAQKTPPALRKTGRIPTMPAAPPEARNLTIFDLTERTCKWPVGEGEADGQRFCGAARWRDDKPPYCEYHYRVAYRPVEARAPRLVHLARAV